MNSVKKSLGDSLRNSPEGLFDSLLFFFQKFAQDFFENFCPGTSFTVFFFPNNIPINRKFSSTTSLARPPGMLLEISQGSLPEISQIFFLHGLIQKFLTRTFQKFLRRFSGKSFENSCRNTSVDSFEHCSKASSKILHGFFHKIFQNRHSLTQKFFYWLSSEISPQTPSRIFSSEIIWISA